MALIDMPSKVDRQIATPIIRHNQITKSTSVYMVTYPF